MIGRTSAAALLTVVLAGCGGTEIKGIIRDEESGEPLPGAIVRVGEETTRTGVGGFYDLEVDVDDDEPAQMSVGAPGYEPKSMIMSIDEDQETVYSDIDLRKEFSERELQREQFRLQRRHLEQERQALEQQKRDFEELREQQDAQRRNQRDLERVEQNVQEAEQNVQEAEQNVEDAAEQVEEKLEQAEPPQEGWTPLEPVEQPEGQ